MIPSTARARPQHLRSALVAAIAAAAVVVPAGPARAEEPAAPLSLQQRAAATDIAVHRGLRTGYRGKVATENSVRSCVNAVVSGADACEVDVRITRNGVPVLMHDPGTRRTTRGGKKCSLLVARHTYQRLARCRLVNGDKIPRLTDLAASMRPYRQHKSLVVELKGGAFSTGELARVNRYLRHYGFSGANQNLVYESYDQSNLRGMKHLATSVPGYLISKGTPSAAAVAAVPALGGLDGLILPYGSLVRALSADPGYVAEFTALGLDVMPWLVNSPAAMQFVLENGASGFMTDSASTLRAALRLRRYG